MNNKPILVTGASGFVGEHMVRLLRNKDLPVRAMVRDKAKATNLEAMGAKITVADLGDEQSIREAVQGVETIYHIASIFRQAGLPDQTFHDINRDGVRRLFDAAIDAGADLVLGHHPHILKGIEVYNGKVIFHSLCNFAFDLHIPQAMLQSHQILEMVELYNWDIAKAVVDYPSYPFPVDSRKTILAKCIIANKRIEKVSYLPVFLNRDGQPEVVSRRNKRAQEVFEYVASITQDQALQAQFTWEGDEVVISG